MNSTASPASGGNKSATPLGLPPFALSLNQATIKYADLELVVAACHAAGMELSHFGPSRASRWRTKRA